MGPNGESVCFKCGMKDEDSATKQFAALAFNEDIEGNKLK